jgi:pimeloyl-ACP methyl ester carboxylesterase
MKHILFSVLLSLASFLLDGQKTAYTDVEDLVVVGSDTIYYSYAFGLNKQPISKLVIIIPGSGPTDRDGNSLMASGKSMMYKFLADSLSKHGMGSIRYDKPGIGKSTLKGGENGLRFGTNVSVVKALINKHKKEGLQIYLAGHSEGSLVGILAANEAEIAGFISLAGPARNAAETLKDQLQKSPSLTPEMKTQSLANLDSLKNGFTVNTFNPLLGSLFRPSIQPYLISWFKYTPTTEIAKLEIPVLVIQGEKDIQVPTAAAEALDHYAKNSSLKIYPDVNHVLKEIHNDEENKQSYSSTDISLSKALVKDLIDWLNAH